MKYEEIALPRTLPSSPFEDDLAECLSRFERFVGLGDFFHRQDAIDHGMQQAGFDVAKDLVELGETAHGGAEDREELEEDEAKIERRFAAGSRAARDEAPTFGERTEGALKGLGADVLDDDVDA